MQALLVFVLLIKLLNNLTARIFIHWWQLWNDLVADVMSSSTSPLLDTQVIAPSMSMECAIFDHPNPHFRALTVTCWF